MRLQELLKSPTKTDVKIVVRQLDFVEGNRYRVKCTNVDIIIIVIIIVTCIISEMLRDIKQSGEIHLIVDCQLERISQVLKVSKPNKSSFKGQWTE